MKKVKNMKKYEIKIISFALEETIFGGVDLVESDKIQLERYAQRGYVIVSVNEIQVKKKKKNVLVFALQREVREGTSNG
jgi:hypothetical protein